MRPMIVAFQKLFDILPQNWQLLYPVLDPAQTLVSDRAIEALDVALLVLLVCFRRPYFLQGRAIRC